ARAGIEAEARGALGVLRAGIAAGGGARGRTAAEREPALRRGGRQLDSAGGEPGGGAVGVRDARGAGAHLRGDERVVAGARRAVGAEPEPHHHARRRADQPVGAVGVDLTQRGAVALLRAAATVGQLAAGAGAAGRGGAGGA